jgi:membrane protease YdiL (CAAX protease family)
MHEHVDPSEFAPPNLTDPATEPAGALYADEANSPLARFRSDSINRAVGLGTTLLFLFVLAPTSLLCVGGLLGFGTLLFHPDFDPAHLDPTSFGGDFFAATFFGGFTTLAICGLVMGKLLGWRAKHILALRLGKPSVYVLAFAGAMTVGFLPGWVAEQLWEVFPDLKDTGSIELITRMLTGGSAFDTVLMIATICVGAPLLEELCFRGVLWTTTERMLPKHWGQIAAFVLTSLAFVVAHADPVQSPALLFTAFFLGWLRLTSGSVWPGVLAHFINNSLAVVMTMATVHLGWSGEVPLWFVFGGATFTVLTAVGLAVVRNKPLLSPESSWDDRSLATDTE